MSSLSSDDMTCFLRQCGVDQLILEEVSSSPMNKLKQYVIKNNLQCDNLPNKEELCQLVLEDLMTKLGQLSSNICNTLLELQMAQPSLNQRDKRIVRNILYLFGIETKGLSDREKCEKVLEYYQNYLKEIEVISQAELRSNFKFPSLKKILITVLIGFAHLPQPSCASTQPSFYNPPNEVMTVNARYPIQQCKLELATMNNVNNPFIQGRYFVTNDIIPEVKQLSQDALVINTIRESIYNSKMAGTQSKPTATFLLGPSGAGKTTSFNSVLKKNPIFLDGVQGAIILNTDEIMEQLPGYSALIDMGIMNGKPISDKMVANTFHEPAESINELLLNETIENQQSFVFDGTGNNLKKLQSRMTKLKNHGFEINAIVITADADIRLPRVHNRGIATGRFVPEEVVRKGKSTLEWQITMELLQSENLVNHFTVIENT